MIELTKTPDKRRFWRPFKNGEFPEYLIYKTLRNRKDNKTYKILGYDPIDTDTPVRIILGWLSNITLFEDFEILIEGEYQIVGKER